MDEELEHHLRSLLSQYGTIISTRAGRDKKQRPYCFVQFKGDVLPGVFSQPHYLGGRLLRLEASKLQSLEVAVSRRERPAALPSLCQTSSRPRTTSPPYTGWYPMALPTPILAVCGIGPQVSRKALFDRFKSYGYIQGIDIGGWEADNRSAFIYYSNAVSVQRALQANHGLDWMGSRIRCEPSYANTMGFFDPVWSGLVGGPACDYGGWHPNPQMGASLPTQHHHHFALNYHQKFHSVDAFSHPSYSVATLGDSNEVKSNGPDSLQSS